MQNNFDSFDKLANAFWNLINGDSDLLGNLIFSGDEFVLPSRYDVTAFSSATIGVASLAVSELKFNRTQSIKNKKFAKAEVNSIEACAAFKGDSLFLPIGWKLPSPWDPFAGDYQCEDHWIRLHTNYKYHRDAVMKVVGLVHDREELAKKVSQLKAYELEQSIYLAGGCSAVMYDRKTWSEHDHGKYTLDEKIIQQEKINEEEARFSEISEMDLSLKGIRVLDMTRVIAGPTCTKFLSAHGAEVLRIDPPMFSEVEGLLPEATVGKRRTFLDIKSVEGRKIFEKLIKESHVFVHGLRPDALLNLGIDQKYLHQLNPSLIIASLNAYGSKGPWRNRRGFDSLVQMSSGIAEAGASYKNSLKPVPLPVQALDYGTGYMMAASICRSLSELFINKNINSITGSLIGASNILQDFVGDFEIQNPDSSYFSSCLIKDNTYWGGALRVQCPGTLDGERASWSIEAGPLGFDSPQFI